VMAISKTYHRLFIDLKFISVKKITIEEITTTTTKPSP